MTHYLVRTCDMGIEGVGLASGLSNLFIFFGITLYPMFIPEVREALKLPNREIFYDLGYYMRMALPICFMQCFEWWAFEVIVLMSGAFGVVELAAQTILINVINIFYNFVLGYQTAVSSKIGFELGRQNISEAYAYNRVATRIAIIQILGCYFIMYGFN